MSNRNVSTAAKSLKKIEQLKNKREIWRLKEAIAHEKGINCELKIQSLEIESQMLSMEKLRS